MATFVETLSRGFDRGERRRLGGFFGAVVVLHVAGFGCLLTYGLANPSFLALGALAYSFGLRHAFDADHISAIDNTTRKLLQQGKKPMGVGFFFSLGHSSVVLLIALALGLAVRSIVQGVVSGNGELRSIGGVIGTSVSGTFLVLIGVLNLVILVGIVQVFLRMRRGEYDRTSLDHDLVAGGVMSRIFGRLFRVVEDSWHMYPIGFLFGLGFDTASEVALLAVSAGVAAKGLPFIAVVSLPLIFAAGMSLMDTADGAFMAKAYSWAFSNPVRKVFYNMTVTALSVLVALVIGVMELAQILIQVTNVQGQPWEAIARLDFIGQAGFVIVGLFVVTWVVALLVYRLGRVEERWGAMIEARSAD
ncbi:MAG: HoxN/HupN/NixA family nickel/cobalt transporter [Chloroflexi bacterium]|nr:MAG: HoxN/HupN/NixA family nickel/cobalt transporter [Chloroflexota bacterium]